MTSLIAYTFKQASELYQATTRFTPERITRLEPEEIFVFGSNEAGRHGKGAAKQALHCFGALTGRSAGLQGSSYGIPTKDADLRVLPLDIIQCYVNDFMVYARKNPDKTFLVTKVGCGLARYGVDDIGPLFESVIDLSNVILPHEFWVSILKNCEVRNGL